MDKALLTRATSKEDAPTPGYLYGEIARMTQHSYDTCTKVMEFLISRVKNKHHTVKFKALQVIKHVCREGRVDFKREMQKNIPIIKECLQFRGVPDPLKGDEYYRRVRDSAKECLDAIYDTDQTAGLGGMGMSARIQGVGNPADNSANSSGWGSKFAWGKSGNDSTPAPGGPGGPMPPYGGGPSSYGYPSNDPNQGQGGYGGPAPYGQSQPPAPYQPEYPSGGAPPYGGPTPYGGAAPPYGGATPYGGAAPPYGGGPSPYGGQQPPFMEQKISGIGNPMYQDARDEKGFFAGLKEKAASKFTKSEPPRPGMPGAPPGSQNPPEGWSFATNRGPTSGTYAPGGGSYNPEEPYRPSNLGGAYRPGSAAYGAADQRQTMTSQLREKSYDGDRKKGRVGGAWGAEAEPPQLVSMSSGGRDNRAPSFNTNDGRDQGQRNGPGSDYGYDMNKPQEPPRSYGQHAQPPPPPMTGQTSGAKSDGSYERNLVTALCAPGGMRAIPPKDKMDAFVKSAITLDAEIVGPILEDCLADAQWTVVSKALTTIDALLKADGCEHFGDYFTENYSEIESCAQSDKVAVRDRAVKVLSALGHATNAPSASTRQRKTKPARQNDSYKQEAPQEDLLGGFSDPEPSSNDSLFMGLQTASAPQQQSFQSSQVSVSSASNDMADMFGGLSLQSSTSSLGNSMNSTSTNVSAAPEPTPAPAAPATSAMVFDPLLEPVPAMPTMNQNYGVGVPMNMNMMNYNAQMAQMQQMQYMQQMQQMQFMQMQQMQTVGAMGPDGRPRMGSQVIGAAMTPTGYIAKTIHEPSEDARAADTGFGFMKKSDDSFNFVKDAMKNG